MDKNEMYKAIRNILGMPISPQAQKQEVYKVLKQCARVFVIVHHLVGGSGHIITVVKAKDEAEARAKYKKAKPDRWDIGIVITEVTDDVQEVFDYDNPMYEG